MYVTHKEEDHGHFRRSDTQATPRSASIEATNKLLTLSDNFKADMVSKFKYRLRGFLNSLNDDQTLFRIYLFYPLLYFIQLAYFILALFRFYVTTGTILFFDQVSNISIKLAGEVLMWSTYLVYFIFLLLLKISSTILSPVLRTFAPYIMGYNRGLSSRTSRRSTMRYESPIIFEFDVRLMVFSELLLQS